MSKIPSFVWVVLVIVLGIGFLVFLSSQKNSDINAADQNLPVDVEVYIDYNCPHCANFEPFVADVKEQYGEKANVQTKMLPFLTESSTTYAYAAEAARSQGRFDDYNHDLFRWITYQADPNNTTFEYTDEDKTFFSQEINTTALAERLELDVEQFENDVNSDAIKNNVKEQKESIVKLLGTQSTPTVLIYGKQFTMTTYEDLGRKVGELINEIESKNSAE